MELHVRIITKRKFGDEICGPYIGASLKGEDSYKKGVVGEDYTNPADADVASEFKEYGDLTRIIQKVVQDYYADKFKLE